jgi:hypothetical protein
MEPPEEMCFEEKDLSPRLGQGQDPSNVPLACRLDKKRGQPEAESPLKEHHGSG